MNVYVFGNQDVDQDSAAIKVSQQLKNKVKGIKFIFVKPNQDLPFINQDHIVILDVAHGIDKIAILNESDIDKLNISKSVTVHDFDLGFQLKYLKKIGKLKDVTIIALPQDKNINYLRIQSILRKLVAQDIQGS